MLDVHVTDIEDGGGVPVTRKHPTTTTVFNSSLMSLFKKKGLTLPAHVNVDL